MTMTDEDQADYFSPNGHPETDTDDVTEELNVILGAPDYSSFIKKTSTRNAKDYEKKIQSLMKAGFFGSVRNGNIQDAALFIHHGPTLAATGGALADVDERVARVIDMVTAPDNPYVAFLLAAAGFAGQYVRNHEREFAALPTAAKEGRAARKARKLAERENGQTVTGNRLTVRLPFGKSISLGLKFKFRSFSKLALLWKLQTHDPAELVNQVFSDEKLLAALRKEGIVIGVK